MGILKSYNESRLTEARFGPGGNPKSSLPTTIKSRVDDLTRMTKIIASGRGLKFISNNAGLNQLQTEDKIADAFSKGTGRGLKGKLPKVDLGKLKDNLVSQAKDTANLIGSTLAQVPLNGTGTHLVHKFRREENTKIKVFGAPLKKAGSKRVSSSEIKIDTNYNFSTDGKDEINLSAPYILNGYSDVSVDEQVLNDLAPLRFSLITPENTTFIQFRAFITQFGDNYSSNWNSYKYLGRGENFYTYNTFDRGITLGFKIVAMSKGEMKPLYSKIDTLASSTAPTYNDAGFIRGTLTRLTVGGYVKNLPGFVESVSYTINQDDQWDIGTDISSTNGESLPMSLDCSVNFKPIHSFIPQSGRSEQTRYVSQDLFSSIDKLQGVSNGVKLAPTEPITIPSLANIPRIKRTPLPPEIGPGEFGVFTTTGDESFLNEGL